MRLILPGDRCLLCWVGVANPATAMERLRSGPGPRGPWHAERAGSPRSLNSVAAHLGLRMIEDLVAGRLSRSAWVCVEWDEAGIPRLEHRSPVRRPDCPLCARYGLGDLADPAFRPGLDDLVVRNATSPNDQIPAG